MISDADADENGTIAHDEFLKMVTILSTSAMDETMMKAMKLPKPMKPTKAMKAMKRARCRKWCSGVGGGGGCCGDGRCKRQCGLIAKHPCPTNHMCQGALEREAQGRPGGELQGFIIKAL